MIYKELKLPPEKETVTVNRVISSKNTETSNGHLKSVCFLARYSSAIPYFMPAIRLFTQKGVEIYVITAGAAQQQFEESIRRKPFLTVEQASPLTIPSVQWAIVSADIPADFEAKWLRLLSIQNPRMLICAAEERPMSISSVLNTLYASSATTVSPALRPDIILTPTRNEACLFQKQQPDNVDNPRVFPIGNFLYDNIMREYAALYQSLKPEVMRLLHIPESKAKNHKIITYAGIPEAVFPDLRDDPEGLPQDLNSLVLYMALSGLRDEANQHLEITYHFLYRPHPKGQIKDLSHPVFKDFANIPNLHIVMQQGREWDVFSEARSICAVSDVVINSLATLGEEIALVQENLEESPRLVVILSEDYVTAYREAEITHSDVINPQVHIDQSTRAMNNLKAIGVPCFVNQLSEVQNALSEALQNSSSFQSAERKQFLTNELRARANAAVARFYWWLRIVSREKKT